MPTNITENLNVIDMNPTTFKPILYTTYESVTKYNLHIVYEDGTFKDVELVEGDKNRPYRITFKREGRLITATGVPKIHEINECHKMCDFVNRTMDSNDLLIELDCSNEYECNKIRFYLKDVRDIVDLAMEEPEDNIETSLESLYAIYVNGFSCKDKIYCRLGDNNNILLYPVITRLEEPLSLDQYDNIQVFIDEHSSYVQHIKITKGDSTDARDRIAMIISEEGFEQEIKIVIGYDIIDKDHHIFHGFTIIPTKIISDGDNGSNQPTLSRAVATSDMQYLGDGLKTALGVGLTPGYKEYRNKKSYKDTVLTSAT